MPLSLPRVWIAAALMVGTAFHSVLGEEKVDFNRDIRPLLSNRCNACHGPDEAERKADLRLDTRSGAMADMGGYSALVPGDPEASELFYRITTDDDVDVMPPTDKGPRFTDAEVDLIRRWIEQGGEYDLHWSYQPVERPPVPVVEGDPHPIDAFVRERLKGEDLEPSPRADRLALARRLSLDLTGLPPSWEESIAFRDDDSPEAVGKYVDSLLAKPAFGERWARVWLDLARYADSAGYADDPPRTIWAYRDYVIRSFNANKPLDDFTIEQIAGDLLEDPDEDDLIATAFHRNTLTNNEGGTNDEEFRNVAVVDRVNTTMAVWMGTTMACAQCHTHKYDPLTHLEYFQLFDFFNQSADADKKDESPLHEIWTEDQLTEREKLDAEISALRQKTTETTPEIEAERERWTSRWRRSFSWRPLVPTSAEAASADIAVSGDGAIHADPKAPTDRYELEFDLSAMAAPVSTGLRLEISPEQKSNFVLSRVTALYEPADVRDGVKGKFVRVELPGKDRMLHLAEVEVISAGKNVAREGIADMSSLYNNAVAARGIDGKTNGDYAKLSVFHTAPEDDPWFEIELKDEAAIDEIKLWNRTDGGEAIRGRIKGYRVVVLDAQRREVFSSAPRELPAPSHRIAISGKKEVPFSFAAASYEQKGFPAASVLESETNPEKGWAIAGGTGETQELLLVFAKPFTEESGRLRLVLEQKSKHENHLLKHFRVGITSENRLSEWAEIPADVRTLLKKETRSEGEEREIIHHFQTIAPSLAESRTRLASLISSRESMMPTTTVPVMSELPSEKKRDTHIHIRGSYQNHGEEATAGVPAIFHPLREEYPKNRLALAHWLVDPANPLTARVLANRFWEQLFGIGLVETSEEFGSQGTLPSHPELLDWLAVELRDGGWDTKAFLKRIVTSETYLQSSKVDPAAEKDDPYNRLLARGPRFRISAEMVRDQALAVSGLLSEKRFGPPVNPPQPELGLKAAFGGQTDWKTSTGEDRYRRGLYTRWRRSSPYPSMATFDAPNREVCTIRRGTTNTPLQALVTLNDPVYVEAAQSWGRQAISHPGTVEQQIAEAFRRTLIREPEPEEITRLSELHRAALTEYQEEPEAAREMAENPIGPIPKGSDPAELAAWTIVGNVVLNLDEMFLKR